MSRKKDLILNTIIIAIGKCSTQVVSIILLPIYTSILTTQEYGTYDLIITITTFLVPFITLLMEESMFRFLIDAKDKNEKREVISQTFIYSTISSIIFILIIIVIGNLLNIHDTYIFIGYLISNIIIGLRNAIVRGNGKIKLYSLTNFLTSLITIILNIIFIVKFRLGYYGLLYSSIIACLIVSSFVFIKIRVWNYISLRKFNKIKMKEMIKYSIPLVPNSISWAIINLSDRLVISGFLGTSANGIYSMAYKFPNIMDTIYNFFYIAWKESAAKVLKDQDAKEFYNNVYHALLRFLIAITLGILAFMPFIFPLLIKEEFAEAYKYIPMLLIAMFFNNISGFYGGIFSAYKSTKIIGSTTIISAVINLVVNLALIKFIGIWAAALSTLISTFIVYKLRNIKIKEFVNLQEESNIVLFVMLVLTIFSYYNKDNLLLNLIVALIITIYSFYINQNIIKIIFRKITNGKFKIFEK